jgi:hypothetical protein
LLAFRYCTRLHEVAEQQPGFSRGVQPSPKHVDRVAHVEVEALAAREIAVYETFVLCRVTLAGTR